MSEINDSSSSLGEGGITFIEPKGKKNQKKRSREEVLPNDASMEDEVEDDTELEPEAKKSVKTMDDIEVFSEHDDSSDDEDDKKQDSLRFRVHRLLAAKRRMRRLGKHVMTKHLEEDKADVEGFMALTKEQQLAYLALYEFDSTSDDLLEGMSKVSSMAVRTYASTMCSSSKAEIINRLLDSPEVKDCLATAWDCVGIGSLANSKPVKFLSATGHVGDAVARCLITVNAKAEEISKKVKQSEELEKRKASGTQSIFDFEEKHASSEKENAVSVPSEGGEPTVVGRI